MKEPIAIFILIVSISVISTLARPDHLTQQRYEFQEFHASSSDGQIASALENAKIQDAPTPALHEPILWSQLHQNEVNAFAEMFRQSYNQMVEDYNQMMKMHHRASTVLFLPVTYELYHVPDEVTWNNYFGNQQQYVHDQTMQMSRQLIQDLEQGRVSSQDVMNPSFFVNQAASELNRVHQKHNEFEIDDEKILHGFGDVYQQHQFDTFDDQQQQQQQQQHEMFSESIQRQESDHADQILVYNNKTGQYQYVTKVVISGVPVYAELAGVIANNASIEDPSNIQPVRLNNGMSSGFSQDAGKIEVHTHTVSVNTPRQAQTNFNEREEASTSKRPETMDDKFYGSTYDQQPIYDLQFVESISSTVKPSMVMPLVRNNARVKISTTTTTTEPSTTTTSATTKISITESNIMSMLPNKKPSLNYTDIYHKIRAELDSQMKQVSDNKSEETHFMGMSSNIDHGKLSYVTTVDEKDHREARGDQPSASDDYIYKEYVNTEPGIGYYSVSTEHGHIPTTSVKSSTASPVPSSTKPIQAHQPPFYVAPLAPFPKTTVKPNPNPYYSAPLASFPGDNFQALHHTSHHIVQSQIQEFSEFTDMNQEVQIAGYPINSQETIHDFNEQHDNIFLEDDGLQISHGYHDMQQFEDVQQRNYDISVGHYKEEHGYERQLPPEQSYRNPELHLSVAGFKHDNDVSTAQQMDTTASIGGKMEKKNWFQRQFTKIKHVFE